MSTRLPDKLSELLYIALEDLEKVEADPRYKIDMGAWHRPNGKCSVCAAGSVMAMRLGVGLDEPAHPGEFDWDTDNKLMAINALRVGALGGAASFLGIQLPASVPCEVAGLPSEGRYALDEMSYRARMRKQWKNHMVDLIGILQAEGL